MIGKKNTAWNTYFYMIWESDNFHFKVNLFYMGFHVTWIHFTPNLFVLFIMLTFIECNIDAFIYYQVVFCFLFDYIFYLSSNKVHFTFFLILNEKCINIFHDFIYIYIGTSKKNWIWLKSSFFLVTSKSETFVYFRLITCKVKHLNGGYLLFL